MVISMIKYQTLCQPISIEKERAFRTDFFLWGYKKFGIFFFWLVVSTPLKNMKVNGKDYPIYYGK